MPQKKNDEILELIRQTNNLVSVTMQKVDEVSKTATTTQTKLDIFIDNQGCIEKDVKELQENLFGKKKVENIKEWIKFALVFIFGTGIYEVVKRIILSLK